MLNLDIRILIHEFLEHGVRTCLLSFVIPVVVLDGNLFVRLTASAVAAGTRFRPGFPAAA